MSEHKRERNDAVVFEREQLGLTYREIAERHNITLERARQIVLKRQRAAEETVLPSVESDEDGIERLGLSLRSYNQLCRAGIETVGDLCRSTPQELLLLPNFGRRSLADVVACLGAVERKLRGLA